MTKAEKRQLELKEEERKKAEAEKAELENNLKALFNAKQFYFVEADETGRHVYYGTFWDRVCLDEKHGHFNDLEGAINTAIKDRDSYTDLNEPIFVYPLNRNYEKEVPWFALMKSGEIITFSWGYYFVDQKGTPTAEIISKYFNQEGKIPENMTEKPMEPEYIKRYEEIFEDVHKTLKTEGFYAVSLANSILRFEDGKPVKHLKFESQKAAISYILADKQTDNNKYPTVFSDVQRYANYVYFDTGEIYKFNVGYYKRPLDMSLEQAIDTFYTHELKKALWNR